MAVDSVEKDVGSQRHRLHGVSCVMCECGLEPLQFNWLRTAMQLYNSLIESNSFAMKLVLHADMQLSTRFNDCWSVHIFLPHGMDGLTQSYIYKQKQQNCETIDLSRFVVDLRERHLEHWTPSYSDTHPREHKPLHVTTGVLFLQKGL